ncbi:two-component SAPR family response regulator [Thermosipho japonicus]|uniref:Two-component SAPR family response regulator n=1 Tax=Thermosipho japonicus TaxID=90323 RepID=A0A841GMZ0_9BACT|nr:hypothetical protein [Thermosipho japonicus]MBB6063355.1 two-component SAPR family response regulator [Thermosipho japonicus]
MIFFKLFGDFKIFVDGKQIIIKNNKNLKLLFYIISSRKTYISKEEIYEIFWKNMTRSYARKNLNVQMYNLKKTYEFLKDVIKNYRENIHIDRDKISSDYEFFMDNIEKNSLKALKVYSGDFLEGYEDDWIIEKRKQCRKLANLALYFHTEETKKIEALLEIQKDMREKPYVILFLNEIKKFRMRKGDFLLNLENGALVLLEKGNKTVSQVVNGFLKRSGIEHAKILNEDEALNLINFKNS